MMLNWDFRIFNGSKNQPTQLIGTPKPNMMKENAMYSFFVLNLTN